MKIENFKKIYPNLNDPEPEKFEQVKPRLKQALPNFPDCVLEQWIYRHFPAIEDYWWLGFEKFDFKQESWSNTKIMNLIGSRMLVNQDYWGDELVLKKTFRDKTWLGNYFHEYKTTPKPIIILKNDNDFIDPYDSKLFKPYHLLEGHMRLGYLRAHIRHSVEGTPNEHEVWVVTINN